VVVVKVVVVGVRCNIISRHSGGCSGNNCDDSNIILSSGGNGTCIGYW
jgi:hypothetical protein